MVTKSASSLASNPVPSQPARLNTSSVSERLTNSEIESLRQHKKESLAYMQKNYFPNAKIHQAA
jgi:hypothetical protein